MKFIKDWLIPGAIGAVFLAWLISKDEESQANPWEGMVSVFNDIDTGLEELVHKIRAAIKGASDTHERTRLG